MIKHLIRPQEQVYYPEDVGYLVYVCNMNGYQVSRSDAQWAWQQHSDDFCASWLPMNTPIM